MHLENELVLLGSPFPPDNGWVDDVVPSFPALPAESAGEIPCDDDPILRAVVVDLLSEDPILFFGPLVAGAYLLNLLVLSETLRAAWLLVLGVQKEPSFEASYFCLVHHELAKSVPRVLAVDLNQSL